MSAEEHVPEPARQVSDAYSFRESQRTNVGRSVAVLAAALVLYYGVGLLFDAMVRTWVIVIPPAWSGNWNVWELVGSAWPPTLAALASWQKIPFITVGLLAFVAVRTFARMRDPMRFFGPAMEMRNPSAKNSPGRESQRYAALLNTCEEVRVAYGFESRPVVRIVDSVVPNALTVGHDPNNSTLVVTTALVDNLTRDELRAVVAHELSHVYSGDARLGLFIAALTYWYHPNQGLRHAYSALTCDGGSDEPWEDYGPSQEAKTWRANEDVIKLLFRILPAAAAVLVVAVITLAAASALYAIQRLGALFASRSRDYLADARAVDALREHENLGRALLKIALTHQRMPDDVESDSFYSHQRSVDFFFSPEMAAVSDSHLWHAQPSLGERLGAIGVSQDLMREIARWRPGTQG